MNYMADGRLKVAWVATDFLVEILNITSGERPLPDVICLPMLTGVPSGTVVLNVAHDRYRKEVGLLLWNPSFERVPNGEEIPSLNPSMEISWERIRFRRDFDGAPIYVNG